MSNADVVPQNHIYLNVFNLQGTKEQSHAYLDCIVTLAHEEGFPLAYLVLYPPESRVTDVSLTEFNDMIDRYRNSVNRGLLFRRKISPSPC